MKLLSKVFSETKNISIKQKCCATHTKFGLRNIKVSNMCKNPSKIITMTILSDRLMFYSQENFFFFWFIG